MHEVNNQIPASPSACPEPPTSAERQALVYAYQHQALSRPDRLAANLGLLLGDLLSLAHGLGAQLQARMRGTAETPQRLDPRSAREVEFLLKLDRQIDRFSQLERHDRSPASQRSLSPQH